MRVTRTLVGLSLVVGMLATGVSVSSAGPNARSQRTEPHIYLALGDSVAAGFQPDRGITNQGYVNDLARMVTRTRIPDLRLRNLACPGETSHALISGTGSPCYSAGASQLDAALDVIHRHPGDVAFVTIDIGGNDLLFRCVDGQTLRFDRVCVIGVSARIAARVEHIVRTLRGALGSDVPVVGMTYYNPFLGVWGLLPGGHRLAHGAQRSWTIFNGALEGAFADAGAHVADVAKAFRVDDFAHTVMVPGVGEVPFNVAFACLRTWFCSSRFTGDPHPTQYGYLKIARTFRRTLERI